jgi:hypothetical protein
MSGNITTVARQAVNHPLIKLRKKIMFDSEKLAEKVNSLSQSSVSNILEISLAFFEAKQHLPKDQYCDFLNRTRYKDNSSMIRKYLCVGKSYQRLSSIAQNLPPVFTTIYKLSTVTAEELDKLIASNILHPDVQTREIDAELKPHSKKQIPARFTIEFNDHDCDFELKALYDVIKTNYASFLQIKMNDEAKEMLCAANNQSIKLSLAA